MMEKSSNNLCKLCSKKEAKYVCPKCNILYCSLLCYQSEAHMQCSEDFYRENVMDELKNEELDQESQKKMLEILQRVQQIGDGSVDDDGLDDSDDDSEEELAARLAGVDIDDTENVWKKLTQEEKNEFEQLLRSGDVSTIVPEWHPWWFHRDKTKLVVDLDTSSQHQDVPPIVTPQPTVKQDIQPLAKLSKVSPSPTVRWTVVNVLAAYSVTARVYNGDHLSSPMEATTTLVSLSASLRSGQVFTSPELATSAVQLAAVQDNCFVEGVDVTQLQEDVKKLVEGPCQSKQEHFVLAALSDIHCLLSQAKRKAKDRSKREIQGEFSKRFPSSSSTSITSSECNNCVKKVEYLLSWSKEYF